MVDSTPRDAKVVSILMRSFGVEECEPMVLVQVLEYAYKYATDILKDAKLYSEHCKRTRITVSDIKLALQTKIGRHFVPPPPRDYINELAVSVNSKPLIAPDSDFLLSIPPAKIALFNLDYEILKKDSENKRRVY